MLKPFDTTVLGNLIEHRPSSRPDIFTSRFGNVPDVEFSTWIHMKDKELVMWVAKPKRFFGTETKTPPFVFLLSKYTKGYSTSSSVSVRPYNNEFFEKENSLGFHSL